MTEQRFNIIFQGEILAGTELSAVKANVAQLFKANDNVVERLFSGKSIAIKKNVDQAGAMKYRALMKRAGAVCYAEKIVQAETNDVQVAKKVSVVAETSNTADQPSAQSVNEELTMAPVGSDVLVEKATVEARVIPQTTEMNLAPPGTRMAEEVAEAPLPVASVEGIDLSPVGSNVLDPKPEPVYELPTTDHLDLAPVGADVADPVQKAVFVVPDLEHVEIAPVGADLVDEAEQVPDLDMDVSHIHVEG